MNDNDNGTSLFFGLPPARPLTAYVCIYTYIYIYIYIYTCIITHIHMLYIYIDISHTHHFVQSVCVCDE